MKKALIFVLFVVPVTLFAQLPEQLLETTKKIDFYKDYEGSIYSHMRYKEADVIDENSGTYTVKLRYNIYLDQIEYKKGSQLHKIVKTPTAHVRINKDYYYYCNFKDQRGLKRKGYYVLVDLNENYRIYKKYTIEIREPVSSNNVTLEKGSISRMSTYYLEQDGTILELPKKEEALFAALGDTSNQLKSFFKKERIKLKKEEDLVRLISKYDVLNNIQDINSEGLVTKMQDKN